MSERILCKTDDRGNATITLNRPEVHNAFDPELVQSLTATLEKLDGDPAIRTVVLAGAGRNFCAGADIAHMRKSATFSAEENRAAARRSARMFYTLYKLSKPTLACVRGAVRGGGCGLVAACDIAIAARSATFRLSEVKLGIIPAMISPYVIAAIGTRMAQRYMLSGEAFDAAEARRTGLVHEVVDEDQLDSRVAALLGHLRSSGPNAMAEVKRLIPLSAHTPIGEEIVEETARRIAAVRATPEAQEGLSAFLEKRSPSWAKDRSPQETRGTQERPEET